MKPRVYRWGGYWYIKWPHEILPASVWVPLVEWVESMNRGSR